MRIGVDTGGTFTDVVLVDGARLVTHKRLSTPADPAVAVLAGIDAVLAEAGLAGATVAEVVHGSTVATNALLERRGARAALVTNEGFEDVLEIGRQDRPALHALRVARPAPVIPRALRLGVRCRRGADGRATRALEGDEVARVVAAVRALRPESVAVVLLHSYLDGSDEARLAGAIEAALGVPVTASHRLLPEYREYERTSTAAVNAYVAPKMAGYLTRLESALGDRPGGARLSVMQSDGGVISAGRAAGDAVHTILSGPAGGVVGATHLARLAGEKRLVTFDMGGTSTDVCFVEGEPAVTTEATVGGVPIRVPLLDVHTVGAGGGSIARRDAGGALRVGPESAGADPGPACYGRGGGEATVTDAHVVLGRLPAERFLGGGMTLDADAAQAAVGRLASELGLSIDGCAEGIVRVAEAVMARAIRRISLERGHDPRRLCLVTFGGAGGLHACGLAEALGIPRVLVPRNPGLLSAYGMLAARPGREQARSVLVRASSDGTVESPERVRVVYGRLAGDLVAGLVAEGHPRAGLQVSRFADLRYAGQSYELTVPFDGDLAGTVAAFHQAHSDAFGTRLDRDVEWVAARVRVRGPVEAPPGSGLRTEDQSGSPNAPSAHPPTTAARLLDRETLSAGERISGPTILTEYSSTTWVPAGWQCEVTPAGALRLTRR